MFEEICLVCGKHLNDNDRAYCSEECQNLDTPSPALSSASSVVSSPNTGHTFVTNISTLVPSALASALSKYSRSRHNYSVSSSSASSTSWSLVTDDEDAPFTGRSQIYPYDGTEYIYEDSPKPTHNFLDTLKPSALSYARRPSGTNYRSTVPNPKQSHSRSTSAHVRDVPRSAPLHSHLSTRTFDNDDLPYSDVGFSSRDESESGFHIKQPNQSSQSKRNRASLPAYFSLLQISTRSDGKHISPVASSSGNNTITRPSPPTPKIPLAGLANSSSTIHATPRGRRRTQGESMISRSSVESTPPRSRSRRGPPPPQQPSDNSSCLRGSQAGNNHLFSAPEISRGRPTVRRNSSPPAKMTTNSPENPYGARAGAIFNSHACPEHQAGREDATWSSGPGYRRTRGRAIAEVDIDAPGFGHGRSGLLDRERRVNRPL